MNNLKDIIAALKVIEDNEENIEEEPIHECPMCLDEVEENNKVVLECGHHIHLPCFFNYLKSTYENRQNKRCPMCRGGIEIPNGIINNSDELRGIHRYIREINNRPDGFVRRPPINIEERPRPERFIMDFDDSEDELERRAQRDVHIGAIRGVPQRDPPRVIQRPFRRPLRTMLERRINWVLNEYDGEHANNEWYSILQIINIITEQYSHTYRAPAIRRNLNVMTGDELVTRRRFRRTFFYRINN